MDKQLQKIPLRIAYFATFLFYIGSIATHIMVLSKVIPYTSVNGGRSASYAIQAQQSVASIAIISALGLTVWMTIRKGWLNQKKGQRAMFVLAALWTLGFVVQLLGTSFERYVMSVILFVGIITHLRLSKYRK